MYLYSFVVSPRKRCGIFNFLISLYDLMDDGVLEERTGRGSSDNSSLWANVKMYIRVVSLHWVPHSRSPRNSWIIQARFSAMSAFFALSFPPSSRLHARASLPQSSHRRRSVSALNSRFRPKKASPGRIISKELGWSIEPAALFLKYSNFERLLGWDSNDDGETINNTNGTEGKSCKMQSIVVYSNT